MVSVTFAIYITSDKSMALKSIFIIILWNIISIYNFLRVIGRLSKEEIEKMVTDAKKYNSEDEQGESAVVV